MLVEKVVVERLPERYWIWPIRLPHSASVRFDDWLGQQSSRITPSRVAIPLAVASGVIPFFLTYDSGIPIHQFITALAAFILFTAAVFRDDIKKAGFLLMLSIGTHSAAVLLAFANDPDADYALCHSSEEYWGETREWIRTGDSHVYEPEHWAGIQAWTVVASGWSAYTTLSLTSFLEAIKQLDMMNVYVGRLVAESEDPWVAVALGWHAWSICRAIGLFLLSYECVGLSLERLVARPLSTRRRRYIRWTVGFAMLTADAILKLWLPETVRSILCENLVGL